MKRFDRIHQWIERLIASDPGRTRFKKAAKATTGLISSILTTLLVMLLAGNVILIPAIISGIVGMLSIIIVMDDTEAKRKVTTLLIGVSAVSGMTIGSLISGKTFTIDILMILIIFCSFYFSKYGSRYFSIGQMGFMTIYFSSVMQLSQAQLPWVYMGIAFGVAYAFLLNFILFQNSAQALKQSMRSFHTQANLTFNMLIEGIQTKGLHPKQYKKIEKNVRKLRDYASITAGHLNDEDIRNLWPGLTHSQLRLYVFDTGMLIETLTESLHKLKTAEALEIAELRRLLVWIMTSLRDADINSEINNLREAGLAVQALRNVIQDLMNQPEKHMEWVFLIRRIESIANHIVSAGINIQQSLQNGQVVRQLDEPIEDSNNKEEEKPEPSERTKGLTPAVRKSVQALIASFIAIIVGGVISPIQPYWVLLTVFICLLGTESIGRIYTKGFQRSSGTVIGAAIGFLLARLLTGHTAVELLILVIGVFMAIYTVTVSYTSMSVFITMIIAFMYDMLLGGISLSLIGARIIDTIVGAVIAYVVSMIIFPKKTNQKVSDVSDDYLEELKPFVVSYVRRFREDVGVEELTDRVMNIDTKLRTIENEAEPLMKRTEAHSHSRISKWVTVFTAINYYARHLISSSYRKNFTYPEELTETFKQMEKKIEHNIDTLSALIKGKERDAVVYKLDEERKQLEQLAPDRNQAHYDLIHHLYYVWRINQSIVSLSVDLGADDI